MPFAPWSCSRNRPTIPTQGHRGPRGSRGPCRGSCCAGSGSCHCWVCRRLRRPSQRRSSLRGPCDWLARSWCRSRCGRRRRFRRTTGRGSNSGQRWFCWSRRNGLRWGRGCRWSCTRSGSTWRCRFRRRRCHCRMCKCCGRMDRRRMCQGRCTRLRYRRRVSSRRCSRRLSCRWLRSFLRGSLDNRYLHTALQQVANLLGNIDGDRTGVRLLFRYSKVRQKVNDRFRLDLQLPGQFVDADLG